ncbi:cytochrome c oxidase subunit IV-domain-containing protein [Lineolata rhizophorae]|uniref:Cytochrome c oxidase polypeptide V n=1 Tax=Lineolata rhizophorae TaxID=578093 RepID=A0A6A6NSJ1_9PEZI|nr:cytochrome c oxidase subunit IV-domain-containing protein [Lineolata rhizophorae]
MRRVAVAPPARAAATQAISNPTLANIEKRWEDMPPQEQAELWMALRDRMKNDWHDMTLQEKKAAYWIAFGPHGPRALPPPGENWEVFKGVIKYLALSFAIFGLTRYFSRDPPKTMTREWQEKTEEYAREQRMEPVTGYKGMWIQSKPGGEKYKKALEAEDEF